MNSPVKIIESEIIEAYEIISCPFCESSQLTYISLELEIVMCLKCSTVYLRKRLKKEKMQELYQSYNSDAPQMFLPRDKKEVENSPLIRNYFLDELLNLIEPKGNLLDIGCGWGAFLYNAEKRGFNVRGVEITKKGAEFAKSHFGIDVTNRQFLDTQFEANSFSAVTLLHVLEHLPEPRQALEKIFNILIPGGVFCGIVPNFRSFSSQILKEKWEWLDPFYHYVHYTSEVLIKHLKNAGFIVERIYTSSGDFNRQVIKEVIDNAYRPVNASDYDEIVKSIENAGLGEEIRFFARKPEVKNSSQNSSSANSVKFTLTSTASKFKTSIIIPVFNNVDFTIQCLEKIYLNTPSSQSFEVIIVDNASVDVTEEFLTYACKIYTDLVVIRNSSNIGFAGACNEGAKKAKGEYIVFLNNDTEPLEGWLFNGINRLLSDESIGIVGAKLLYPDRTIQHSGIDFVPDMHPGYPLWPIHRYVGCDTDDPMVNLPGIVGAVTGACLFISQKLFWEVEGFNEEYKMYFEDTDLCFKVKSAGRSVFYEPASVVIHYEGKSTPSEYLRYKLNIDSAKRFFDKWGEVINSEYPNHSKKSYMPENLTMAERYTLAVQKHLIRALIDTNRNDEALQKVKELLTYFPWEEECLLLMDEMYRINKPELYIPETENIMDKTKNEKQTIQTRVSIIVPVYNQLDYTELFIDSLIKFTGRGFELIIIDNCSSDGTKEYLKNLALENICVKLIFNHENEGFPAAINQGILEATGDYIVIANNDIVITDGWLKELIAAAETDPQIGLVGPISNSVSGFQIDRDAKYKSLEEMHAYAADVRIKNKNNIVEFPRVAFLCTLISKKVIDIIGGLDERFSPGNYEDDDYCLRAQLAGFKTLINRGVFIHHFGSKSFKSDGENNYTERLKINERIFVAKWGATPDEIWMKGKQIKSRTLNFPLNKDIFIQWFDRATIAVEENEPELAAEYINKARLNFHNSKHGGYSIEFTEILNLTGNLSLINEELEIAQACFEEELKLVPNSSRACVGLGEVFFKVSVFDAAKTMFEWGVKNNPENKFAIEGLAKTNKALGLPKDHNSLL